MRDYLPAVTATTPHASTRTERYLAQIALQSFLTLWSYPHIYRDQGISSDGAGKEVVDLLVVFADDILLFSDKSCAFPNSGNLELDWARWFRRAIKKSAEQVWGAERWIRQHPDRLFTDARCQTRLPIPLPSMERARFHRIIIANDETGVRQRQVGGTGTLLVSPSIVGEQHATFPFAVGHLDPTQGYVHVLDETSLRILLETLDTAPDFVDYLSKKEALITSGKLIAAAGEEDLLGLYLRDVNAADEHDFVIRPGMTHIVVPEGHWHHYVNSPERAAKVDADKVSYAWDMIIEKFTHHTVHGSLEHTNATGFRDHERVYRVLARENRTRRRMLARELLDRIAATPAGGMSFRVMLPSKAGDPHYLFMILGRRAEWSESEYRKRRGALMMGYSKVLKLEFPAAKLIVGLATEPSAEGPGRSEDVMVFDVSEWSEEDARHARELQHMTGWLKKVRMRREVESEYPVPHQARKAPKIGRNDPCYCGSGVKWKKCHGRFS